MSSSPNVPSNNNTTIENKLKSLQNSASKVVNKASEATRKVKNSVTQSLNNAKESIQSSNTYDNLKGSYETVGEVTGEFAEKNSFIAKTIFIVFIFILFGLFFRLGVYVLSLFYLPTKNPIVLNGMRVTDQKKIYKVNPTKADPRPILRSIDEYHGMEFTWSTWILINSANPGNPDNPSLFFRKGFSVDNVNIPSNDLADLKEDFIMNSPGLYLYDNETGKSDTNSLSVVISHFSESDLSENYQPWEPYDVITIKNVAMKKWVCVIIRVHGRIIDIYIDGVLTKRKEYQKVIKQNYGDIQVGSETEDNPIDGYISMLRYFDHAIGNNIIQDILHKGPNLKMEGDEVTNAIPPYLSVNWYLDKAQNTT